MTKKLICNKTELNKPLLFGEAVCDLRLTRSRTRHIFEVVHVLADKFVFYALGRHLRKFLHLYAADRPSSLSVEES